MSQLQKLIQVLDLFSETETRIAAEEIAERLGISRPTAFRYVKQLCEVGLLVRFSRRYALGARIIQLDHRIRRSDPMLLAARDLMAQLAQVTACAVVLSSVYGDRIINIHHEAGRDIPPISYERGQPLPLFRGAAPKIILAFQPRRTLKRRFEVHRDEPDVKAIAHEWEGFYRYFQAARRRGYYISREELDRSVVGIAAPILNEARTAIGCLQLVFDARREALIHEEGAAELMVKCAAEISERINR
ncbi:MAG: IclR family transcriptional regulator [Burkholderiales bacterium]|nr:IclR family transcriptional regulator [Burkholderiales bacterium]